MPVGKADAIGGFAGGEEHFFHAVTDSRVNHVVGANGVDAEAFVVGHDHDAGDGREVNDGIKARHALACAKLVEIRVGAHDVIHMTRIGDVGDAVKRAVDATGEEVDTQDAVALGNKVLDEVAAGLSGAACDENAHVDCPLAFFQFIRGSGGRREDGATFALHRLLGWGDLCGPCDLAMPGDIAMPVPSNPIKAELAAGRRQMGIWIALASATSAEIASRAGFDFCLIDGEHAPNDIPLILDQARAIGCGSAAVAARVPVGDTRIIKQYLDLGIQTLVVPMIDTGVQAASIVAATRYPPDGIRGVGAAMARASNFGEIADVTTTANGEICLFVQAESRKSVANIDEIAATPGVDGVFIGPADLAADMGLPGQTGHPDVQAAIRHCFERIHAAGKKVGIIAFDEAQVRVYVENGADFVAVGGDVSLLAKAIRGAAALAEELRAL